MFEVVVAPVKYVLCPRIFHLSLQLGVVHEWIQQNNRLVPSLVQQGRQTWIQDLLMTISYHVLVDAWIVKTEGFLVEILFDHLILKLENSVNSLEIFIDIMIFE